jgi:DNA-binding XRE family transcriptional regulator
LERISITVHLEPETINFLHDVAQYENLKSKFKNGRPKIKEEDVIKAAVNYFIKDIRNFYKHQIIRDVSNGIGEPYILKNRIREILKEKDLKQLDLCALTGIDKTNISLIINNKHQPSLDLFLRIWVALDYPPIEDIFHREL